ncbi:MAG: toprim domain-containing protein [Anaerolineales bacterium]|nr:toprim domain-containing protein [Anaerolineales bacterium]
MRAAEIARALGGKRNGQNWLCRCPAHDDASPSLSIRDGADGKLLLRCFAGCDGADVLRRLRDLGLSADRPEARPFTPRPPRPADDEAARIRRAMSILHDTRPAGGTLVETYLRARECWIGELDDLRFHPSCPIGDGKRAPAMVALMLDPETGEPCGIHRTPLKPDGSGRDGDRKMLGRAGVVMLSRSDEVTTGLGIAEGIESALTVMAAGWRPVWACLSAGGIERFPILAGIEAISIFADNDNAGVEAARKCAIRWHDAGRRMEMRIIFPWAPGHDWNDEARNAIA